MSDNAAPVPGVKSVTKVGVREMALLADVGINPDEIGRRQPLVISVELTLQVDVVDAIDKTVDYRRIAALAEELASSHIPLIETFAHLLAARCLAISRVTIARVAIDKPFALSKGMANVNVEMHRQPT